MKTIKHIVVSVAAVLFVLLNSACSNNNTAADNTTDAISKNVEKVSEYKTAKFSYLEKDSTKRTDLCDVKYYVNGDTLFTSEKYHEIALEYTDNNDKSRSQTVLLVFDRNQKKNAEGWYHFEFKDADINHIANVHLSGIILLHYIGEKYTSKEFICMPDAYLFKKYREDGKYPKELDSELIKLNKYI